MKLDDIYEPIRRATSLTDNIIYGLHEIGKYFLLITSLIPQCTVSFQDWFKNLYQNMNDFVMHIVGSCNAHYSSCNLNNPNSRRKPIGAFDAIGSGNTLFGTATQGQIYFIHKCFHSLDAFTEEERKKS